MQISAVVPVAVAEPSGRRYIVLKIATHEGILGFGEGPAGPDPQTVVDGLKSELSSLGGLNPSRLLQIDARLANAGASYVARGAANIALMDILGKTSKAPLFEALGSSS